ncbi:hypothetical protein NM688_g4922 [Phlebia brevispora]|uniref:Uncharacterized protein n=1 Tax=Phlebia brevispora TaxID=194682 RepID=A0ACC1T1A5_9APHY|nr:hypothetical protein NM688_g4922 [Phlebia brevispora]
MRSKENRAEYPTQSVPVRPRLHSPTTIMFRTAYLAHIRPVASTRTFVSTVLLTRNWENETVNALKKEARSRGLSQSGNKATLITRLQDHERRQQYEAPVPPAPVQHNQVRHASTTELPGVPSTSQPSPLLSNHPKEILDVKIPNASYPIPELPVQIPFVPDLWDSSRVKAEAAQPKQQDPFNPKVIAVGGAVTHLGGGPSHALYPEEVSIESRPFVYNKNQSFWRDLADDFPVPTSFKLTPNEVPKELLEGVAETTEMSGRKSDVHYSRTLDQDEKRGVWALLGLLAGSWALAGFLTTPSAFATVTEPIVAEEATEKH